MLYGATAPVARDGCTTLKVSTEKIPDAQVLMTIEVEPERLDDARSRALRKLAPRAKVPAPRQGAARHGPPLLRRGAHPR
jgi:hypothetical protein